jgi:DNA-binding CsgD family transcriptional regulator
VTCLTEHATLPAARATDLVPMFLGRAPERLWSGRLAGAMADATAAMALTGGDGSGRRREAAAWLALCHIERDELDVAAALLAAHHSADEPGLLALARGRLALECGDPSRRALDGVLDAGSAGNLDAAGLAWRPLGAVLAHSRGDCALGLALAQEGVLLARVCGDGRALGVALRAAGMVAGGTVGIAMLSESVAVLEPSTARLELAWSTVRLGSALRGAGLHGEARTLLREGLEFSEHLGARRAQRLAREELRAAGARPRRRRATGLDSLTPSELRLAELVGQGLSNREIAEALVVTMKTVEWHLRHLYRKLGVVGRSQLVTEVARLSVVD